ncbi:hypothetical protein MKW98_027373 [Papaver atlanticum]|uniref:MATH domain-containing protein n=1 Tax=Papaver atlanticum TaxID=357466 RepID=A0AAD4XWY3_9MAGN|nr:hypothetical protein MKW98_027373 [Papaver atlanticum]
MAPKRPRVSKPNTDDDVITSLQWICETVKGCHEFKIKGYSTGIEIGESMTSGKFIVGGHDWVILFNPDGEPKPSEEYLSLYLQLVSPREARATFECKLLDPGRKGKHGVHYISECKTFVTAGTTWDVCVLNYVNPLAVFRVIKAILKLG